MAAAWIQVTVRYIRPAGATGASTTILVGPCERGDLILLPLTVGPADASLLDEELRGDLTAPSSVLALLGRVATALGGKATAAYLMTDRPGSVRASLELCTFRGRLELSIEPGQALAAAVGLNLPLLADPALFTPAGADQKPDAPALGPYLLTDWNGG